MNAGADLLRRLVRGYAGEGTWPAHRAWWQNFHTPNKALLTIPDPEDAGRDLLYVITVQPVKDGRTERKQNDERKSDCRRD